MKLTPALLPLVALVGAAAPLVQEGSDDPRETARAARLSLREAIARARVAQAGRVVEVELESEDGRLVFEVDLVSVDGLHEIDIDARTGALVEIELEDDPEELAEMRALLDAVEVELRDLVGAALGVVNGRATSAELELEDDGPVCEIELASGPYLLEVEVDAKTGALLEVELEEPDDEDGEDDEDD